jgi:hypothetical protein
VTVLAVADEIDDNIVLELSAPISGKLADVVDSLDIIGIDVEDRGVDSLGDIRAVCGRSSESRVGSETNLVVDNQVDGTASREGGQ